jgi:hypothetical protein
MAKIAHVALLAFSLTTPLISLKNGLACGFQSKSGPFHSDITCCLQRLCKLITKPWQTDHNILN